MLSTRFHCALQPIYTSHIAYQQREFQMFCVYVLQVADFACEIFVWFLYLNNAILSVAVFQIFETKIWHFNPFGSFSSKFFPITRKEPGIYIMQNIFTAIAFLDYFRLFLLK